MTSRGVDVLRALVQAWKVPIVPEEQQKSALAEVEVATTKEKEEEDAVSASVSPDDDSGGGEPKLSEKEYSQIRDELKMEISGGGIKAADDDERVKFIALAPPPPPQSQAKVYYANYAVEHVRLPEDGAHMYSPRDNELISLRGELDDNVSRLREFFERFVLRYLRTQTSWGSFMTPPCHAYAYGMRGVGRFSCVLRECRRAGVSLIYVRASYYVKGMYELVMERARQLAPCVVYINDDDSFETLKCLDEITYALRAKPRPDRMVWTVLAARIKPRDLPHKYKELLGSEGVVVYTPLQSDRAARKSFFVRLVERFSSLEYPFGASGERERLEWDAVATRFAAASEHCTYAEMTSFVRNVFREHLTSRAYEKNAMFTAAMFSAALDVSPLLLSDQDTHTLTRRPSPFGDARDTQLAYEAYMKDPFNRTVFLADEVYLKAAEAAAASSSFSAPSLSSSTSSSSTIDDRVAKLRTSLSAHFVASDIDSLDRYPPRIADIEPTHPSSSLGTKRARSQNAIPLPVAAFASMQPRIHNTNNNSNNNKRQRI